MGKKINKNSFIVQGSILAMAGILVRIIGLIYRVPLTRILGDEGNGYYSIAFDIYNILILLSSQSMPLAVSKIVSEKLGKGQYKNAHRVFKGALAYALVLGIAVGSIAFFGADFLAGVVYKTPPASYALKVLAPTLTVSCILGVMRGYFQGMGNMVPTAVSQIFEQIVNAIVSILAAYQLGVYALSVYGMRSYIDEAAQETMRVSYGAAGGTLGTLAGAVTALIVMVVIYVIANKKIKAQIQADTNNSVDSYSFITKAILFTITPVLLSTTIYNIGNLLDNPIYQNIMELVFNVKEDLRVEMWGIYSGKYRVLTTVPIAIASALSTAIVPSLVRSYSAGDYNVVKEKVSLAFKFAMFIAFPCGVGLSVLGGPINQLLFGYNNSTTTIMMLFSVFTVVTFCLSTISNAILQGINKLKVPIYNSGISLIIHLIILPILLLVFKLNIYAVVIGDFLFAATVCYLNNRSIKKFLDYKMNISATIIKPLISSVIMGAVAWGSYKLLDMFIHSNTLSTLVSIIVAVIVYCLAAIVTKTITEEELLSMPKGGLIVKVLKKFHLF